MLVIIILMFSIQTSKQLFGTYQGKGSYLWLSASRKRKHKDVGVVDTTSNAINSLAQ